jgi:hypothetical protein
VLALKAKLKCLFVSLLFSGIIVFLIGLYFSFFKAGVPYQDPTTEMTIRWMAYAFAGDTCMFWGTLVSVTGLVEFLPADL